MRHPQAAPSQSPNQCHNTRKWAPENSPEQVEEAAGAGLEEEDEAR